jgi:methyltransferase (TIGR00027 family)
MRKGRPSRTAYKVALNLVTLGSKPGMDEILPPGIVEATATLLTASGAVGARAVRWARSPRSVSIYEAFDWMLPGQFEAFAYRKAFCERQAREGIEGGATQVLVLGAGYDTLGWRLAPEYPAVRFFEIDHPPTARLKARGIEAMGWRDNLHLVAEDLGERRLSEVLNAEESWDPSARTVIVAEGLVMYLAPEAVRHLFRQCAAISGAGSRIAFSYIPSGEDGRPDAGRFTGLLLWLQRLVGEPWLWSVLPLKLGSFLKETGWAINSSPEETGRKYGVEYYAVAMTENPL